MPGVNLYIMIFIKLKATTPSDNRFFWWTFTSVTPGKYQLCAIFSAGGTDTWEPGSPGRVGDENAVRVCQMLYKIKSDYPFG